GTVLCFVYQMRPEILESSKIGASINKGVAMKKVIAVLALVTLLTGSAFSVLASAYPDGLEWSIAKLAGTADLQAEGQIFTKAAAIQENTALMPDYDYPSEAGKGSSTGTTVAGIIGSILTFALAGFAGWGISKAKKKKKSAGIV
ncbi:MAG: PDGLE domain-containing protein, partial [Clostridiales bacterium]